MLKKIVAVALVLLAKTALAATPVLDQSQPLYNYGLPFTIPSIGMYNFPIAQSFTAGMTGTLDIVQIGYNGSTEGKASFAMMIRDGDGLDGTILGGQSILGQTNLDTGEIVNLDVSTMGIRVAAGHQYTFEFIGFSGLGNSSERGPLFSNLNPYAGGRLYSPVGYGDMPDWDLAFQTFVTPSSTSPVPEPDSVSLLLVGLAAVAGLLRTNKRA